MRHWQGTAASPPGQELCGLLDFRWLPFVFAGFLLEFWANNYLAITARFERVWRRSERRAGMTSKIVSSGLNTLILLGGFVPKMCPKKVAASGLKLIPVTLGVC